MDSNKFYKIALIIMFVVSIYQIARLLNNKYEHLNPALLNHQYVDLAPLPTDNQKVKFVVKNSDRYNAKNKYNPVLVDPLVSDTGFPNIEKHDWATNQEPGANNTYDDLLWHQQSPSSILQDNSLYSNTFDSSTMLNAPDGIASNFTRSSSDSLYTTKGALSDQNLMDPHMGLDVPTNYNREFSTLNTGLPPMKNNISLD